jgi:hypothetical protein
MRDDPNFRAGLSGGLGLLFVALLGVTLVAGPASSDEKREDPVEEPISRHEIWAVMSGASLKSTIEGWARSSGWTVIWDNPFDYRIRASATFHGGFEEAVARLIDAIHQNSPEMTVTLYRGNRVIHVEDVGAPGR